MGGRGGASGIASSNGGNATHQLGYADTTWKIDTKYKGSAEEVARADEITNFILERVYRKNINVVLAVSDVWDNGFYSNDKNAKDWAKLIENEGFAKTKQGAINFFVSKSPQLKFVSQAKTAKEVIDKYGDKVPENVKTKVFKVNKNDNRRI